VHDVAWAFAEFVNEESYKFAATGKAEYPFVAPEGGKEPLRAEYSAYTMGSDHDVYQDSSFGIPAIYMNDWPDRYIHTNFDTAANIDTTKLKRAAFIGAASAWFLAGPMDDERRYMMMLSAMMVLTAGNERRKLEMYERMAEMYGEKDVLKRAYDEYELMSESQPKFEGTIGVPADTIKPEPLPANAPPEAALIFRRAAQPRGPLAVFGYDYFADHGKVAGVATPKLLSYEGLWGAGEEYAYEVLNFADGRRNAQGIRDRVTAEYGPLPLEMVVEYLRALEKIGVVTEVK
jgi:aminopeptidase YwaD